MTSTIQNQYYPDVVSCPGEILAETLEERNMTQSELSLRMGRPEKTISEIINGKSAITPETALQLERVLDIPARFWNNCEQHYRDSLARKQQQGYLSTQLDWSKQFPYAEMSKLGWVKKTRKPEDRLDALLSFFSVVSPEQYQSFWQNQALAFRKSNAFDSNWNATNAWLRQGELQVANIQTAPYQADLFKKSLHDIRSLTIHPIESSIQALVNQCAKAGVAIVFVPTIKGVHASGVMRWLTPEKALIQMSLRYKRDDHFWFTFFHEARHVLQEKKKQTFIDVQDIQDYNSQDELEQDASKFAADFLISPSEFKAFCQKHRFDEQTILDFADRLRISPGIVAGRLQREKILEHYQCKSLFKKIDWDVLRLQLRTYWRDF